MKQVQEIFDRIQDLKIKIKDINGLVKEAKESNEEWVNLSEKIKKLQETRKGIEVKIKDTFSSELTKLDDLKIDLNSDSEMLTDVALNSYVKGKTIEVEDRYGNKYDPLFSVKFKK